MAELQLLIVTALYLHWIGDFVFQTDWQARNKSKSNKALGAHVLTYTLTLLSLPLFGWLYGVNMNVALFLVGLGNGIVHFGVDYITSRVSSEYYRQNRIHEFFVVVGLDQFIHTALLVASLFFITTI